MFVNCPTCAAHYDMPDDSIGANGRKVRCSSCKTVWHVEPVSTLSVTASIDEDDNRVLPIIKDRQVSALEAEPLPARINLKIEQTTDEDWTTGDDQAFDNSQDDIDALFNTPSAAEFGGDPEQQETQTVITQPLLNKSGFSLKRNLAEWFNRRAHPKKLPVFPIHPNTKTEKKNNFQKNKTNKNKIGKIKIHKIFPVAASLAAILFLGLGMGVVYRQNVVYALPQSATLYRWVGLPVNLRGVVIDHVNSRITLDQGSPELTIEGEITNITRKTEKLARLRFAVRSSTGTEIYSWKATLDKPVLEPGESLKFKRKLASPPEDGHDVVVRFETRNDMVAGVQ